MPNLIAFIESHKNDKVMYGRFAKRWESRRNKTSKHFVDTATYSKTKYRDFLTGPAYLFTSDIFNDMCNKAFDTIFLKYRIYFPNRNY